MGVSYHPSRTLSSIRIVFPLYSLRFPVFLSLTTGKRDVTIPTNKARASWKGSFALLIYSRIIKGDDHMLTSTVRCMNPKSSSTRVILNEVKNLNKRG